MESAPQSTITHNAVIEFAFKSWCSPRRHRGKRQRIKRRPALPKGRPQIGGTMPKSHPLRNAAEGRNGRFRQVFAPNRCFSSKFRRILEMAVGEALKRYLPALGIQKLRT